MKRLIAISPVLSILSFLSFNLLAQSPVTIIHAGQLSDINDELISEKTINVSFEILNSDELVIYENTTSTVTGKDGVFVIAAQDLPNMFTSNSNMEEVDLLITVTSNDKWLEEGKFRVKYHLKKDFTKAKESYELSRFEGQVLSTEYQPPLWSFYDQYPFAYLQSIFMISFSEELTDPDSIILAGNKFIKGSQNNSRGLKGGFAVGGYKSRN